MRRDNRNIIRFENLSRGDVGLVGGKNSSLGEMVSRLSKAGIKVPPGYATTADAFRAYMDANQLNDMRNCRGKSLHIYKLWRLRFRCNCL